MSLLGSNGDSRMKEEHSFTLFDSCQADFVLPNLVIVFTDQWKAVKVVFARPKSNCSGLHILPPASSCEFLSPIRALRGCFSENQRTFPGNGTRNFTTRYYKQNRKSVAMTWSCDICFCLFFASSFCVFFVLFVYKCNWKEDSGGVSRHQKAISRPTYHTLAYLTHLAIFYLCYVVL